MLGNPTQKSPERAFALQKYLLLHSQHDALQKHLNAVTASLPAPTPGEDSYSRHSSISSDSSDSSFSYSPPSSNRGHHRSASLSTTISPISETSDEFELTVSRPQLQTRRSSLPSTLANLLEEAEEDEQKLMRVNQQIKSTLTDLLNCESVRHDRRYRMWVQTRLMDAEKELKDSRWKSCGRRRSSVDMDTLHSYRV